MRISNAKATEIMRAMLAQAKREHGMLAQAGGYGVAEIRSAMDEIQALQRAVMALELMNGVRIECNVCEGTGEVCIGHTSGGYWSPPEPVEDECPICEGWGHYNKREIHEEWDGPPCAEAAIEMLADSYTEREYEND